MRQMRSSMLDSLGADYVRTARAKGLSECVGRRQARAAQQPDHGDDGRSASSSARSSPARSITEQIFVIPGFGRLTIDAVNQRDYALIQGVVLVAAAGYVVVNLLVDVVYSLLNPRIRVVGSAAHELRRRRPPSTLNRRGRAAAGCCASGFLRRPLAVAGLVVALGVRRSRRSSRRWIAPYSASAHRLQRAARARRRASTCSAPTSSAATSSRGSSGARAPRSRPACSRRCSRW